MLYCKSAKNGGLDLTDKKTTVTFDGTTINLAGDSFSSSGEYESNGVEVVYGQTAALIVWERLQVVYIFDNKLPTPFESAQFSSCDVLVLGPSEATFDKTAITPLLDTYDPTVIILSANTLLDAALKETLKTQETDLVKLAAATLPVEGRDTYQLQ